MGSMESHLLPNPNPNLTTFSVILNSKNKFVGKKVPCEGDSRIGVGWETQEGVCGKRKVERGFQVQSYMKAKSFYQGGKSDEQIGVPVTE